MLLVFSWVRMLRCRSISGRMRTGLLLQQVRSGNEVVLEVAPLLVEETGLEGSSRTTLELMVVQSQENPLYPLHHHHNPPHPNQPNPIQPNQHPTSTPHSPKRQSNFVSPTEPDSLLNSIFPLPWKTCIPSSRKPVPLKTANLFYRLFSRLEFLKEDLRQWNRKA